MVEISAVVDYFVGTWATFSFLCMPVLMISGINQAIDLQGYEYPENDQEKINDYQVFFLSIVTVFGLYATFFLFICIPALLIAKLLGYH